MAEMAPCGGELKGPLLSCLRVADAPFPDSLLPIRAYVTALAHSWLLDDWPFCSWENC